MVILSDGSPTVGVMWLFSYVLFGSVVCVSITQEDSVCRKHTNTHAHTS